MKSSIQFRTIDYSQEITIIPKGTQKNNPIKFAQYHKQTKENHKIGKTNLNF